MYIITNFEALNIDLEELGIDKITPELDVQDIMDDLRHDVFVAIKSAYYGEITGEWYLYEDHGEEYFLFGGINPDALIARANTWNKEILDAVGPALIAAKIISKEGQFTPDKMEIDNSGTYNAKKAIRELDNDWFAVAEHGVYLNNDQGYPYFKVKLNDRQLEELIAHPENYIIVEISPK